MAERREIVSEIIEDMLCEKILRLKTALELSEKRVGNIQGLLNPLTCMENPGKEHEAAIDDIRKHISETCKVMREALEEK